MFLLESQLFVNISAPNTSVNIRVRILLYAKRYHSQILSFSLPIRPGISTCISDASLRPNPTLQLWIRKMPKKKNRAEYFESIKLNLLIWRLFSEHQIIWSNYSRRNGGNSWIFLKLGYFFQTAAPTEKHFAWNAQISPKMYGNPKVHNKRKKKKQDNVTSLQSLCHWLYVYSLSTTNTKNVF